MEYKVNESLHFMEICNQIQAASVFLRLQDLPHFLLVQPKRIITQNSEGYLNIHDLRIKVDPSSCSSLCHNASQGVSMRLQIQSKTDTSSSKHSMMSTRINIERNKETGCFYCSCKCKNCGIHLLIQPKVKFEYFLPFHFYNSDDLSGSWTCCSHGEHSQCHQKTPSLFRKEMYHDELFFAFHQSVLCKNNVRIVSEKSGTAGNQEKSIIKCKRCYCTLGQVISSSQQQFCSFYKHCVQLDSFQKDSPSLPIHLSSKIDNLLCEEIVHNVQSREIYKFLICDLDNKPYVLVQVLKINASLGYYGFETLQSKGQENMTNLDSLMEICSKDTSQLMRSYSHSCYNHYYPDAIGGQVTKVLYTSATTEVGKKHSEAWLEDMNVKSLTLPYPTCMETLFVLIKSTLLMPSKHVTADGFLCGFLKAK